MKRIYNAYNLFTSFICGMLLLSIIENLEKGNISYSIFAIFCFVLNFSLIVMDWNDNKNKIKEGN